MDLQSIIISVSIPFLISIFGAVISWQNYKINKKKDVGADIEKERESEARMVNIEADVKYIRLAVDRTEDRLRKTEDRLEKVEQDVQVLKSKN